MLSNQYLSRHEVSGFSLNHEERIYYFGCIILVLLPNHDILNWLFQGTPLIIWKQLLALFLAILSIKVLSVKRSIVNRGTGNIRLLVFVLIFTITVLILTSFIQGMSLHRVAYAVIAYIGFIGALGFAVAAMTLGKTTSLLRLAVILGLISSVGLIIDSFTGFFNFLPRTSDAENLDIGRQIAFGYIKRASFLFGAPNAIFPFISFTLLASAILYVKKLKKSDVIYFISLLILTLPAFFYTGSRSQFMLILVLFSGIIIILTMDFLRTKSFLLLILIFISVAVFFTAKYIESDYQSLVLLEKYQNPFDENADGNYHRFQRWNEGTDLFKNFDFHSLVGVGIGKSLGMVNDGDESITHYESSLFQAFSEGGYLGLILRYFPMFYGLVKLVKYKANRPKEKQIKKLFILWLCVYFASLFAAPIAAAYYTQMIYFIVIAFCIKFRNFYSSIK
jgi:O-antigen ligase